MDVLIVSSNSQVIRQLTTSLASESFRVLSELDTDAGLLRIRRDRSAVVVMQSDQLSSLREQCTSILSVCRSVRILIISASNEAKDRIAMLEAGADDYLGYPFNSREAALRIRALSRRARTKNDEEQFSRGPIQLDSTRYCVTIEGRPVRLTAVEFKLLRRLLAQPGRVQSRQTLLESARGIEEIVETRTIDTHIRRLRAKLGTAAHLVETIRGAGYRLRPV